MLLRRLVLVKPKPSRPPADERLDSRPSSAVLQLDDSTDIVAVAAVAFAAAAAAAAAAATALALILALALGLTLVAATPASFATS